MGKPLIISDCDEVLLHMIVPFGEWLNETQDVAFKLIGNDFSTAIRDKQSDRPVEPAEIWRLLNLFFDGEMHRQHPIAGAVDAINTLKDHADVVVLTNLHDKHNAARKAQLEAHGIDVRVFTNQGPKGPALQAILDEYQPSKAVFIDDLAQHHGSAAELVPHIDRLHLCGEPSLAPHITCGFEAGHAHARIDTWEHALPWLLSRL
ncbi:HAD family hydrolase [Novosphingobium sp.]|uniref:HAD family hydrolase n=1 Tax=Novosphingobium sp. TaxID=1874826 RepID=UPI0035B021FF